LHTLGERSIGFRSLADVWADTTTAHGRLLVTMLAGIAEFERELIKARTGDGRTRAKARGVKFGRPPKLPAACCGRDADGYRSVVWGEPCDHRTTPGANAAPFRGRSVGAA
jgi:DNA invertase Pin-like site-specific DNA recombinase